MTGTWTAVPGGTRISLGFRVGGLACRVYAGFEGLGFRVWTVSVGWMCIAGRSLRPKP